VGDQKLIVMDFSVGEVHVFNYTDSSREEEDVLAFLEEHCNEQGGSFKRSQIEWMLLADETSNLLPVYFH